jgi:hypothetical protein
MYDYNTPYYKEPQHNSPFYQNKDVKKMIVKTGVTSIGQSLLFGCSNLTSVSIPDTVTIIKDGAFEQCTGLVSLTIPKNVTSIGHSACFGCTSLKEIKIPKGVISIGANMLRNCSSITEIDFPDSITTIYDGALMNCVSLTKAVLPDSLTDILGETFKGCINLNAISIPKNVKTIGNDAFYDCKNLSEIHFQEGLEGIGSRAFFNCTSLGSATVPQSVEWIGDYAFSNCKELKDVTLSSAMTYIGQYLFQNCAKLQQITIPQSITGIGNYAFYRCAGLEKITVPDSVEWIGDYAFSGCSKLKDVTLSSAMTYIGQYLFYGCIGLERIIVPGKVTGIGNYAFCGCTGLKGIVIPDSVTSIGDYCFTGCTGLSSVPDMNGVTWVGAAAFSNCTGLTSITLPNSLTGIGNGAFGGCTGITSAVMPDGITNMGADVFSGCTALKKAKLPQELTFIPYKTFNGCKNLTNVTFPAKPIDLGDYAFSDCRSLTSITVPDSVTRIGKYAFNNCTAIKKITLTDSVTGVDIGAFSGCTALASIVIPDSVEWIGDYAFTGCTGLKEVTLSSAMTYIGQYLFKNCDGLERFTIPDTINSVGNYAFQNCTGLKKITVSDSVEWIGDFAFVGCTGLTDVELSSTMTYIGQYLFQGCVSLEHISIPEKVTGIGNYAFYRCTGLKEINIPDSVTSIGNYCFADCTGLTSVPVMNGVTWLGASAFSNCTGLISFVLPKSITGIGNGAFSGCTGLSSVIMPEGITNMGTDVFSGCTALKKAQLPKQLGFVPFKTFVGCKSLTDVVFPEKPIDLGDYAFSECSSLSSINIPGSITRVGQYAFQNCLGMKDITLPGGLQGVAAYAFIGCTNLVSVSLPDTVTWLGEGVFYGCTALNKAVIPESVTILPNYLFYNCKSLTEYTVHENVIHVCEGTFYGCAGLVSVSLPTTLEGIGINAFRNCSGLVSLSMPEGVQWIANYAFAGCTALESVSLPESLNSLGNGTFYGCKNLEEIIIPLGVTFIGTSAFDGVKHPVIFCFAGSYAEEYAAENNIEYHYLSEGIRLSLNVTDPEGNRVTEGYQVKWYRGKNREYFGSGNRVFNSDKGETEYYYEIILGESLSYIYQQVETQRFDITENNTAAVYALERLPEIPLTVTVTDENQQPFDGCEVTVIQSFQNGQFEKSFQLAAEGNVFSGTIVSVPTEVTIFADGYYTAVKSIRNPAESGEKIDLAVNLSKVPSDKLSLSMNLHKATRKGEEEMISTLNSAATLSFELFDETQGRPVTEFTVRYPYLYLEDEAVKPGDTLTARVSDTADTMGTAETSVQLSDTKTGTLELDFYEKGSFVIQKIVSTSGKNTVMLFDASGNFMRFYTADASFLSDPIPEGKYSAVVLQQNDMLKAVSNLNTLSELGLKQGTDYALLETAVKDGVITEIDSVTVPDFDVSILYYVNTDNTGLNASAYEAIAGRYILLTAKYDLPEELKATDRFVRIELPEGISLVNGSLAVNAKPAKQYTYDRNLIKVPLDADAGTIKCYVSANQAGEYDLRAFLGITKSKQNLVQPIGTVHLSIVANTLQVSETTTARDSVTASGLAAIGSEIEIFDGETPIGTAKANGLGKWSADICLHEPRSYSYHEIYAVIRDRQTDTTVTTESEYVCHNINKDMLKRITMSNGFGNYAFDFTDPNAQAPRYTWASSDSGSTFTFQVEIETRDPSGIHDVNVLTKNNAGETTAVSCKYDEASGTWIGTQQYSSQNVPVGVSASFESDNERSIYLDEEIIEEGKELVEEMKEWIDEETASENLQIEEIAIEDTPSWLDDMLEENSSEVDSIQHLEMRIEDETISMFTVTTQEEVHSEDLDLTNLTKFSDPYGNEFYIIDFSYTDDLTQINVTLYDVKSGTFLIHRGITDINASTIKNSPMMRKARNASGADWFNIAGLALCGAGLIAGLLGGGIIAVSLLGGLGVICSLFSQLLIDQRKDDLRKRLWEHRDDPCYRGLELVDEINDRAFAKTFFGAIISESLVGVSTLPNLTKLFAAFNKSVGIFGFILSMFTYMDLQQQEKDLDDLERKMDDCDYPVPEPIVPYHPGTPYIDPSGYVYEAVPSNHLAGVTAEAYYYDYTYSEDGTPSESKTDILWDASEYEQVNPMLTDENGEYQWDVPIGSWLVKFTKEGYYDTDSRSDPAADEDGYLPVPPPQTEVNVAMISKAAPTVSYVNVYSDEIQLRFSQYVKPETVTTSHVKVQAGGKVVEGTLAPVNAEYNGEGTEQYASVFTFTPAVTISGEATVTVSDIVNYAGKAMAKPYSVTATAVARPEKLMIAPEITLTHGETTEVEVQVYPANAGAGKKIIVAASNTAIAKVEQTEVLTDENGKAVIKVTGSLPGVSEISVRMDGADLENTTSVFVKTRASETKVCEKVTANLKNGAAVGPGTELILTTATEGASIYYTLDGTCPCIDDSESRLLYTGPIAITEETFIIAYAVKEGYEPSKTASFLFNVNIPDHILGDVDGDGKISSADARLALRTSVKLEKDITEGTAAYGACDVDGDGKVSSADARLILRASVGLEDATKWGKT